MESNAQASLAAKVLITDMLQTNNIVVFGAHLDGVVDGNLFLCAVVHLS